MAVAAARDVVSPCLHGQLRGLVQSGNFRARLLSADRFQLETALCAEKLTWQVQTQLMLYCLACKCGSIEETLCYICNR